MAFDRSKIKGTSVAAIKDADKQLKKQLGKTDRADKIELETGTNLLRIYPVHSAEDGGGDLFAEPVVMTYLPAIVQEKDKEGNLLWLDKEKKTPKMKDGVKPVFNSKVHGPQEPDEATGKMRCIVDKDLVEEYIRAVLLRATELYGKDQKNADRISYLEAIFGNFAKKINGITYQPKWIAYADLLNEDTLTVKKFGDWEFKKSVHERLTSISTIEAANDPLGTDPFTDPDEGRGVKVLYNPDAEKASDYYTTEIDNLQVPIPGTKYKGTRMLPLTDKQLEAWSKLTPLAKRFRGSFGLKDLKLQINGLDLFDKKAGYKIFNSDEFQALIEAQLAIFPPDVEGSEDEVVDDLPFKDETTGGSDSKDDDEPEQDQFDVMSRAEMIAFNKTQACGLSIKASMSEDDIRAKLRIWQEAQDANDSQDDDEKFDENDPSGIKNGPVISEVETYKAGEKDKKTTKQPAKSIKDLRSELGGGKKK